MIAYEIQLRYVIRDKFSLRQNSVQDKIQSETNSVQDKIQSEKKFFPDHQKKNSQMEFCLRRNFILD